jgi:hypothetical protein
LPVIGHSLFLSLRPEGEVGMVQLLSRQGGQGGRFVTKDRNGQFPFSH